MESFKKKFAAGEADSLEQRTAPLPASGAPLVECLVSLSKATGVASTAGLLLRLYVVPVTSYARTNPACFRKMCRPLQQLPLNALHASQW